MTRFPSSMHYAVRMALEDGIAALDAGTITSGTVPSGVVVSLKTRRADLEAALAAPERKGGYVVARAEIAVIVRLLDALDQVNVQLSGEGGEA